MKKATVFFAVFVMLFAIGGVSAYFTATDEAENRWTVGDVTIELLEEEYDKVPEEERHNITPDKVFTKDPIVRNVGTNDAFVFLEVSVPKANVRTASADGTAQPAAVQELFSYGISEGWTKVTEETSASDKNTYVYAYADSETACSPLKAGGSTPPLFKNQKVTFINILEGQGLEGKTLEIPVHSYGIQTTDLGESDAISPSEVWDILKRQVDSK